MKDYVYILDFSPFNNSTDSLAFDWEYLENIDTSNRHTEDDPEFRYLSESIGIQPNRRNNFGVPKDIIDMFKSSSNSENVLPINGENASSISLNELILNFNNQMNERNNK